MIQEIQYLGIFGNARTNSNSDWYQVINDYNFTNSNFVNNTCIFPSNIVLDIQYSKAGVIVSPQKYIVSARISSLNK